VPATAPARNHPADDVRAYLRAAILRGEFAPGAHLPEVQLANRLEVSRGPVREALAQLEREGLVLLRRNRGAIVARLSRSDLDEVYSLRLALERLAVERATQVATEEDFAAIDALLHQLREPGSGSGFDAGPLTEQEAADQDVRFHDAVYRAAHHGRLYAAWTALRSQVYVLLLARNVANPDFRDVTYKGHLELAYLIRMRDTERARAAIEAHLRDSYRRVLASYPDDGD
jgi:DNA-binding GntR family transcriptional regulator